MLFIAGGVSHAGLNNNEAVETITVRPGITQSYLINHVDNPAAIVILFVGYGGYLNITREGIQQPTRNFLVRTRDLLHTHGFVTVTLDTPSDYASSEGILGWRASRTHAEDTGKIIAHLRKKYTQPVWLIGTSRGSISAANAAARLPLTHIDGLVLTATVVESGGRNPGYIGDVAIDTVRQPTLIVHHDDDGCSVSDFFTAKRLPARFSAAKKVAFKAFSGGKAPQSEDCGPLSAHGFFGIESDVISYIAAWIKNNS